LCVVVDNLLTGSVSNIPRTVDQNLKFIKADVNSFKRHRQYLSRLILWTMFFHYAAVVGVKRTLANPVMVLNDLKGINNILTLSKNTGVKRVFYYFFFRGLRRARGIPQNEYTTPLNSRLPYAIVKNAGEAYLRSFKT
jgi:UDP-glucose 4-epimerase